MLKHFFVLCFCSLHFLCTTARKGIGGTEQDWGHITVRPNAHMFWWLYYTTHNNGLNYTERPLIVWLQGGPGMASSGYGNFAEIGPLDMALHNRSDAFTENFNVLLVDNPVGAGFSYFSVGERPDWPYVRSDAEIGADLFVFFQVFFRTIHAEFRAVEVYVFGESYGGRMATELVFRLKKAELEGSGKVFCNLKGLALGDAYISPKDYQEHYAPLALHLGLVDKRGYEKIKEVTQEFCALTDQQSDKALELVNRVDTTLFSYTMVDVYNFISKINKQQSSGSLWDKWEQPLEVLMNNKVKQELNITATLNWTMFNYNMNFALRRDYIKSVTDKIEFLLNKTDTKILVYNGILDFIVNTAGTISWLDALNWSGRNKWIEEPQSHFFVDETIEGHYKRVDNLAFYTVLRAGHSVPLDNLHTMNYILRQELLN